MYSSLFVNYGNSPLAMMVGRSAGRTLQRDMWHVGLGSLGLGARDLKPEFVRPGV